MKVGDLVQYVTGSAQLYFHFPSARWDKFLSGTIGLIIQEEDNTTEKMYFVKAINRRKNRFYWFYEEELIVLSKAEKKDE